LAQKGIKWLKVLNFSLKLTELSIHGSKIRSPSPQIRDLGKIPVGTPVIEVDADNTETTLADDATITLKPGHRFGKKVKFKRG
jgi:hypothetical protein